MFLWHSSNKALILAALARWLGRVSKRRND